MPKLIEYKDMAPRAKAAVEGIAQARGIEEMHEEFVAVVLAAQKGNMLTSAYRVPVDAAFEEK